MPIQQRLIEFEAILREKHQDIYDLLLPGNTALKMAGPCKDWFGWRNGQQAGDAVLFHLYRFVSYSEALDELRGVRAALLASPLQGAALQIFARRSLYSLPLLIDGSGDGFHFSTISRRVFYKMEGNLRDAFFASFEGFVEYLIEIAGLPLKPQARFFEAMEGLLRKYAG